MALDILPIQASAVPCERVFSSSKETCTARRSRTTPELMEALQVLKYHFRQRDPLNFMVGMTKKEEIEELKREQADLDQS